MLNVFRFPAGKRAFSALPAATYSQKFEPLAAQTKAKAAASMWPPLRCIQLSNALH